MRSMTPAGWILVALVAACGGHRAVEISPDAQPIGNRWNATLATPAGLAGAIQVTGTGWMERDPKDTLQTFAHIDIVNAAPGGQHPWHVHRGQCGQDLGVLGPADAYPVLKVKGDGTAQADAHLNVPVPVSGQFFINVHASPSNMGTSIACGNLAPPVR